MDNPENATAAPASGLTDLQAQCESLRQVIVSMLVLLLIVSGTLTIYLMRQYRTASTELDRLRPQVVLLEKEVNQMKGPMSEFVRNLIEYSKKNPDFVPVLNKYNIKPSPVSPGPVLPPPTQTK